MPDGVLLRRYWAKGDDSAFEMLIARHGPMVLSVCGNLLRDEAMAEDAFQAVFLILVRKARRIRVDDSLGGWLYGVAYKVARRAQADQTKRRHREGAPIVSLDVEAPSARAHDPRLTALHEEIARLPGTYQQALVYCWLEGKTQTEAAAEIGCGEATVRRRLAGARERLRSRLAGEGLNASTPVSLLAVSPRLLETTTRAVRGPLSSLATEVLREMTRIHGMKIMAAIVMIGLTASGVAFAVASQQEAAQPPQARPVSPSTPPPTPRSEPETVPPQRKTRGVAKEPAKDAVDAANDSSKWGTVEVPGKVVDPSGQPVAGAEIFLRAGRIESPKHTGTTDTQGRFAFTTPRRLGPRRAPGSPDVIERTTTLPGGVTITVTESLNNRMGAPQTDAKEIKNIKPWLVATAPGFGFGTLASGNDVTIKLTRDVPVTGRVTDEAGKPLAGARVRVRDIFWPRRANDSLNALQDRRGIPTATPALPQGEGLDSWLAAMRRAVNMNEYYRAQEPLIGLIEGSSLGDKPSVYAPLIPPTTTDSDGRFTLKGIGAERVAQIYIDGIPDKASRLIVVATRPLDEPIVLSKETQNARKGTRDFGPDIIVYGNQFETTLGPGKAIEGVVSDRVTNLPVANVKVIGPTITWLEYPGFDRFFATTDERGHYRIDGFPVMRNAQFVVDVPSELPYFGRTMSLDVRPGAGPQRVDLPLAKGVWITGRVIDDATGMGIDQQSIEYHVFNDNPYLRKDLDAGFSPQFGPDHRTERTGSGGTFRIRGYPGRGIVTAGGGHGYLEGIGADKIKGLGRDEVFASLYNTGGFSPYVRNTTIEVNIEPNADSFECELRLKKGKSRVVNVVDPDGKPQDHIQASGLDNQIQNPISEVKESSFPVTNLFPGESRVVVARFVPKKLMGMAVVNEGDEGPVTLKMVPWASVAGRLVDDQGKPRSSGLEIQLEDGKLPIHTFNGRNYDKEEFAIDSDGRFLLEGLVPGATYRLQVIEGRVRELGDITKEFTLQPGEKRDLGDVKIIK